MKVYNEFQMTLNNCSSVTVDYLYVKDKQIRLLTTLLEYSSLTEIWVMKVYNEVIAENKC